MNEKGRKKVCVNACKQKKCDVWLTALEYQEATPAPAAVSVKGKRRQRRRRYRKKNQIHHRNSINIEQYFEFLLNNRFRGWIEIKLKKTT